MRINYVSYDVWGNEDDGWEVNQAFTTSDEADVSEATWYDDDAMRTVLRELGWDGAERAEFEWHEDVVYVNDKVNGRPEGEFRRELP